MGNESNNNWDNFKQAVVPLDTPPPPPPAKKKITLCTVLEIPISHVLIKNDA